MFSPRAPTKATEKVGTPLGELWATWKEKEIFQDQGEEKKKSQTNKPLSVGNDRLERYYEAGQQDAWLD